MACFLVPTTEAIVVSAVEHHVAKREEEARARGEVIEKKTPHFTWRQKLSWLNSMLWGGAILLCLEHMWHGEVVLYPPFLTAMASPTDTAVMIHEMSTVGVSMAVCVTCVWALMVVIADHSEAIQHLLGARSVKSEG